MSNRSTKRWHFHIFFYRISQFDFTLRIPVSNRSFSILYLDDFINFHIVGKRKLSSFSSYFFHIFYSLQMICKLDAKSLILPQKRRFQTAISSLNIMIIQLTLISLERPSSLLFYQIFINF